MEPLLCKNVEWCIVFSRGTFFRKCCNVCFVTFIIQHERFKMFFFLYKITNLLIYSYLFCFSNNHCPQPIPQLFIHHILCRIRQNLLIVIRQIFPRRNKPGAKAMLGNHSGDFRYGFNTTKEQKDIFPAFQGLPRFCLPSVKALQFQILPWDL